MSDPLEPPPRIVKPRERTYKYLPVTAIHGNYTLTENGEVGTVDEFIETLPSQPPTLFAKIGAADFVGRLDTIFDLQDPDHWQWRASTHERDICRPDGVRVAARVSTAIHYFGFKDGHRGKRKGRAYHKIIDPVTMYGRSLDQIWPTDAPPLIRLLKWAVSLRDFCHDNKIEIRPTTGGISAQLLTDKRFYPNARRKVPAKVNESVREQLPGNHYMLNVEPTPPSEEWRAYYLDQHRAHHYHARVASLPDSNQLYAHGRFIDLDGIAFTDVWPDFHGLYCLDLRYDPTKCHKGLRAFRWFINRSDRLTHRFVYSNELPHLLDMGFRVTGVRAAWGSRHEDVGLTKYAEWAGQQLDQHDDPAWLKPLLLAAYGTLATRPRIAESIFRLARKGEPVQLHTGHYRLNGKLSRGNKKLEPGIANVLHRGMIEAATRSESVGLAQWLNARGLRILSIYADAVIVEQDDDQELPPLPDPWRCKQTLNHLQFINQQAFVSGEMTKLPGVGVDLRKFSYRATPPRVSILKGALFMASEKQTELFKRLTEQRSFPSEQNVDSLVERFRSLSDKEASRWIERALELPEKGDSGEAVPF